MDSAYCRFLRLRIWGIRWPLTNLEFASCFPGQPIHFNGLAHAPMRPGGAAPVKLGITRQVTADGFQACSELTGLSLLTCLKVLQGSAYACQHIKENTTYLFYNGYGNIYQGIYTQRYVTFGSKSFEEHLITIFQCTATSFLQGFVFG